VTRAKILAAALCVSAALSAAAVEVDTARGEVRLPFVFIDPVQAIEVFGCGPGGPTHETVIVFTATGGEIAAALAGLGLRDESFWQVASPQDFMLTQGDRVLCLLAWDRDGEPFEAPAEDLLWRAGEDLPECVHGFSFAGKKITCGEPPRTGVPDSVEITIGGTGRQSAVTSLLVHPSAFAFLAEHVSGLELNPRFRDEVARLSAHKKGGTLILRKVSEAQLVAYRLARTPPVLGLEEVIRAEEPLARAIDADKSAYAALHDELAALLAANDAAARADVEKKLAQASLLTWKIHRAYIDMYELEWAFQRALLEGRLESFRDHAARGHAFLRMFAGERAKLAELAAKRAAEGASPALDLAVRRQEEVIREIQARRDIPAYEAEIAFLEGRVADESQRGAGGMMLAMLKNELAKNRIALRAAQCTAETHQLNARDLGLQIEGATADRDAIAARLKTLAAELALLDLRGKLAALEDEIRWAEDERTSEDQDRKREAVERLAKLGADKDALKAQIDALEKSAPAPR
jgi:hypothetical protein